MEFFLSLPQRLDRRHSLGGMASRRCGFERLESRQMLAADLALGTADTGFGHTGGPTGSIGGSVLATASAASCVSHAAIDSLTGVRVQLLDATGAVIGESFTDATGAYRFPDLIPGQYAVRQLAQHALLEGESLQGSSHVGNGGGIALGSNLVGEIDVQAGVALEGYDFCEFPSAVEPAGPSDRPIVPHDNAEQIFPLLALSLKTTPTERTKLAAAPAVEQAVDVALAVSSPLKVARPAELFGGSSRSLKESDGIKEWNENPFDSLFSMASFLDLAATDYLTFDSIELILREPTLDLSDESGDTSFADEPIANGYSSNATEWWEIDAHSELVELMGEVEIIDLGEVSADVAVPKIARLHDAH